MCHSCKPLELQIRPWAWPLPLYKLSVLCMHNNYASQKKFQCCMFSSSLVENITRRRGRVVDHYGDLVWHGPCFIVLFYELSNLPQSTPLVLTLIREAKHPSCILWAMPNQKSSRQCLITLVTFRQTQSSASTPCSQFLFLNALACRRDRHYLFY